MLSVESARSWYPHNDPVHGFDHVLRVYRTAEYLAQAEGADLEIVRAAALLHDVDSELGSNFSHQGPAASNQASMRVEGGRDAHHHGAAEFACQILQAEGWPPERVAAVEHCIRAHRFRDDAERPQTLEAQVLFDADKLDAIGAIGVARAVAFAAREGQPAYARPSARFLESGQKEIGEQHSAYHEYLFKLVRLKERLYTLSARTLAEERHRRMVAFFENLAAEVHGEH